MQWERVNNHFISAAEIFCTSPEKKQLFLLWVAEVLPLEVFTLGIQMLAYIHNLYHPIRLQRSKSRFDELDLGLQLFLVLFKIQRL